MTVTLETTDPHPIGRRTYLIKELEGAVLLTDDCGNGHRVGDYVYESVVNYWCNQCNGLLVRVTLRQPQI